MRVGRRYKFRAQHHVPGLSEPWGSPHWHDYTVEIVFEGEPENGLLVDHEALDQRAAELIKRIDGEDLNDIYTSTTVEDLAAALWWYFSADEVTVWEDDDRWATAGAASTIVDCVCAEVGTTEDFCPAHPEGS